MIDKLLMYISILALYLCIYILVHTRCVRGESKQKIFGSDSREVLETYSVVNIIILNK